MARSQAFYGGANALMLHDVLSGSDNVLNGFAVDAGVTPALSGSEQTVTTDTQGDGIASEAIFFPFVGATLIASADFSAAAERFRIGVRFLDEDQVLISESTTDFIASGRRSHSAVVPANTVYVQWISTREAATGAAGAWTFERPALRTTSSQFSY